MKDYSFAIWRRRLAVWILFVLDTVRWGSTAVLGVRSVPVWDISLALAMPTVFAVVAGFLGGNEPAPEPVVTAQG
ncbi:MAG: hypothetical protein ACRDH2_13235 [Anaerolineales bacterium]